MPAKQKTTHLSPTSSSTNHDQAERAPMRSRSNDPAVVARIPSDANKTIDQDIDAKLSKQFVTLTSFIDKRLKHVSRDLRQTDRETYQQIVSYIDLRGRFGYDVPIPPLRGHAMSPDAALYLDDILKLHRPENILELGSGFSSAIIARHCATMGGHALHVDHEQQFGDAAWRMVDAWGHAADDSATRLVIAPLSGDGETAFYDLNAIPRDHGLFDFVLLDGPPKYVSERIRGNLLPLFKTLLAPGALVLLDDFYRPGEQAIVKGWLDHSFVEVVEIRTDLEKHTALLRVQ